MAKRLGGSAHAHALEYENYVERAEDKLREAERAKTCSEIYSAAVALNGLSSIANRESQHAFRDQPTMLKQAEARLEKILKRALRIDDKMRDKCLR